MFNLPKLAAPRKPDWRATDLNDIAESLRAIEERVVRIETRLVKLANALDVDTKRSGGQRGV